MPNIIDIITRSASAGSSKTVFSFLSPDGSLSRSLTHSELLEEAGRVADFLTSNGTRGDRALVVYASQEKFVVNFFGCLMAGMIAVPVPNFRKGRRMERITQVCKDCSPKFILGGEADLQDTEMITLKSGKLNTPWSGSIAREYELAFLQYTSGSVGQPKGVCITQDNLWANLSQIKKGFQQKADSILVGWLPLFHDMGLVGNVLQPVFSGGSSVLLPTESFLLKPILWLETISKYRATTSGAPNFGFQICHDRVSSLELEHIDLSTWTTAFCGAEIINSRTLESFADKFGPAAFSKHSFAPCYGLAEATLLVSVHQNGPIKTQDIAGISRVSCGVPDGTEVLIVDPNGVACKAGIEGEIIICGPNVSSGYWNNSNVKENPFGFYTQDGHGPYFRTGDVGMISSGTLFISGRLKETMIVNGRNVYPSDIEMQVMNIDLPEVFACAVFSVEREGTESLVLICEAKSALEASARDRIRQMLANTLDIEYIELIAIRKLGIPKTTSGKIQRLKLKELYISGTLNPLITASVATIQLNVPDETYRNKLAKEIGEFIGSPELKPTDNFFEKGLTSILTPSLIVMLSSKHGIDLLVGDLYEYYSVNLLCLTKDATKLLSFKDYSPKLGYDSLSYVQRGIWFDCALKNSSSYNLHVALDFETALNQALLRKAILEIVNDQEILRTIFPVIGDGPVVRVVNNPDISLVFSEHDCATPEEAEKISEYAAGFAFDVSKYPLFRIDSVCTSNEKHKLIIVFHHIISDGTSITLFCKELLRKYDGADGDSVLSSHSYTRYAEWYNEVYLGSGLMKRSADYWLQELGNRPAFLLPTELEKPLKINTGRTVYRKLDARVQSAVMGFTSDVNATAYEVMLAGFIYLLSRWSNQDSVAVGVPLQGRTFPESLSTLGVFINPVIVAVDIDKEQSFQELVEKVVSKLRTSYLHQLYPVQMLRKLLPGLKGSRAFPLTNVFFNGLNFFDGQHASKAPAAFQRNMGLEMNLDLNCYVFDANGKLSVRADFRSEKFTDASVSRWLNYFEELLFRAIHAPRKPLQRIHESLGYGRTDVAHGIRVPLSGQSILDHIKTSVERVPGDTAFVMGGSQLTYYELWTKSNRLAEALRAKGVQHGDRVPIIMPRVLEYPISVLAVMKCGAVFVPIEHEWPFARIEAAVNALQTKVILTRSSIGTEISWAAPHIDVNIDIDGLDSFEIQNCKPSDLIYGIFTSGSTGMPKCSLNRYAGIANRFAYMDKHFQLSGDSSVLFTSKPAFDASIWQLLWPLTNGYRTIMPETTEGIDFLEFINVVNKYRIGITDFVPSVFNLLVRYLATSQQEFSLPSLKYILMGGEAMNAGSVSEFISLFPGVQVINTYGPSEASIGTIFYHIGLHIPDPIPIGKPIDNVNAYILDEEMQPVAEGLTGDLYLGGVCVGAGYYNDEKKTQKSFVPNPADGEELLYATGDLAYFGADGNIYFSGRKDKQIKINGVRTELGEVESVLNGISGVIESFVFPVTDQNELVAMYYASQPCNEIEMLGHVAKVLPKHMVPKAVFRVMHLPYTTSGKTDMLKLQAIAHELFMKRVSQVVVTESTKPNMPDGRGELEDIWKLLLSITVISDDTNFFEAGGDSMTAMKLVTRVKERTQRSVSLRDVFDYPIFGEFCSTVMLFGTDNSIINSYGSQESYPLSPAQLAIWLASMTEKGSLAYKLGQLYRVEGIILYDQLRTALELVAERHDSLRTVFVIGDEDEVRSKVLPLNSFGRKHWQFVDCSAVEDPLAEALEIVERSATSSFDFINGPLFSFEALKLSESEHLFRFGIHHIISDAWSIDVFFTELMEAYNATLNGESPEWQPLSFHYQDFAHWSQEQMGSQWLAQKSYWFQKLATPIEALRMPSECDLVLEDDFAGEHFDFFIAQDNLTLFRRFLQENDCTLFIGLVAVFKVLLARYTSKNDIIIGTPVVQRSIDGTQNQIGIYLNMLALRTSIKENDSFLEVLKNVRETVTGAFANVDYPNYQLINELGMTRTPGTHPLFDVVIELQNFNPEIARGVESAGRLRISKEHRSNITAKYPLVLVLEETAGGLNGFVEYSTSRFPEKHFSFIPQVISHFTTLIQSVIENPAGQVKELTILSADEVALLRDEFNNDRPIVPAGSIDNIFEEMVRMYPTRTAIVGEGQTLTYNEVNIATNRIGHYLKTTIGESNAVVALLFDRSPWMVIAMLGVLKAGYAYLPLDKESPAEAIGKMLLGAKAKFILTDNNDEQLIPFLNIVTQDWTSYPETTVERQTHGGSLSHIIFTSGSTGVPKGVQIEHHSVLRLVKNTSYTTFGPETVILQTGSYGFDASTFEIWVALLNGTEMHIYSKDWLLNPVKLKQTIIDNHINTIFLTTSWLHQIIAEDMDIFDSVKVLATGGEALSGPYISKLKRKYPDLEIFNFYGPTENTVFATKYRISDDHYDSVPIGTPVSNTTILILDAQQNLCPVGIPGEIYMGGQGLMRGYTDDAETSRSIIMSPFHERMRLYRSGDIGRWRKDGNIEFLGRADAQVKINGHRVEPVAIELEMTRLELCANVLVSTVPAAGNPLQKELVAFYIPDKYSLEKENEIRFREILSASLPHYMIPRHFVQCESFPLTNNGKTDIKKLVLEWGQRPKEKDIEVTGNDAERQLLEIWKTVLGHDQIGLNDDLFTLGGNSLLAFKILNRINKTFSITVDYPTLFRLPTISSMVPFIESKLLTGKRSIQIDPLAERPYYELSFAQKRFWILNQVDENNAFNILALRSLTGDVDYHDFSAAIRALAYRHESMRTRFVSVEGSPQQIIHRLSATEVLEFIDASDIPNADKVLTDIVTHEKSRAFDLSGDRLWKFYLIKISQTDYIFVMNIHHIVADGYSLQILTKDLLHLYEQQRRPSNRELPQLSLQYKDYAAWDIACDRSDARRYWLEEMRGAPVKTAFRYDFDAPEVFSYEGDNVMIHLSESESTDLKRLAAALDVPLPALSLAVFQMLLNKITGQENVCIVLPVPNREVVETENMIGVFTNLIVLKSSFTDIETFEQLVIETDRKLKEGISYQSFPFDQLVEILNPVRHSNYQPMCNVAFNYISGTIGAPTGESVISVSDYPKSSLRAVSLYDLQLYVRDAGEIIFDFEYNTTLFRRMTIERYVQAFKSFIIRACQTINAQPNEIR